MSDKSRKVSKPSLWVWKIFYAVIAIALMAGANVFALSKTPQDMLDMVILSLVLVDIHLIGFLISLYLTIDQKVQCVQYPSKAPYAWMFVFAGILVFLTLIIAVFMNLIINSRAMLGG